MKKIFYELILLLVVLALGVSACSNRPAVAQNDPATTQAASTTNGTNGTVAEGHLKPERAASLSFLSPGTVEEVNVKIGDHVKKGDVLARLSNFEQAQAQVTTANLELTQAQQDYDQLQRTEGLGRADAWTAYMNAQIARADAERDWEDLNVDDIENRIEDDQADVQDREQDLKDAQEEFDKYKNLDEDNSKRKTAKDELETAQNDYNEAVRKLEETTRERDTVRAALDAALAAEAEAKHTYEESLDGPNKEKFALASSRLDNARAQVAAAEDALTNFQITAPFDATVADVEIEAGDQVTPQSRAVSVIDPSAWIVETTDVTELEVVNIAEGQKVTFTADALPDITMKGVVSEVSQASYTQSGDVIYTVRIKADEVDPRLKWGMTVEVNFAPLDT
jgi:HlyD family secretion protein